MKIKVCGMREPQNISDISLLAPDFMGFIFYDRSPRYAGGLPAEAFADLPTAVKKVGVFVDAPVEYIYETAMAYKLDFIQLHGNETPERCSELRKIYGVIKAFGIGSREDFEPIADYEGCCDYYIFDTKTPSHGGSGQKFDHDLLSAYGGRTPYLLSGGLCAEDSASLASISDVRCAGFDINSRFETAPGVKDPGLVKNFIETIKNTKR